VALIGTPTPRSRVGPIYSTYNFSQVLSQGQELNNSSVGIGGPHQLEVYCESQEIDVLVEIVGYHTRTDFDRDSQGRSVAVLPYHNIYSVVGKYQRLNIVLSEYDSYRFRIEFYDQNRSSGYVEGHMNVNKITTDWIPWWMPWPIDDWASGHWVKATCYYQKEQGDADCLSCHANKSLSRYPVSARV
jgi:hypothetical protein